MGSEGWQKVHLGSVCVVNPELRKRDWFYSHIEYIDISSIGTGQMVQPPLVLPLNDAPSRAQRLVQRGDIIVSTVRPNRRSFFYLTDVKPNTVVSTGFAVLRATDMIDPRFLYYVISNQQFTDYLDANTQGSAYPAVGSQIFENAEVMIPPLKEQRAIAHILGTLDDKIELNRRMNQTLEAIAQVIFKSWFVDFLPVRANMARTQTGVPVRVKAAGRQPPGLAHHIAELFPGEFQESELGVIPKGWEVGILGEISRKPQYGYTASANDEPVGPKFLRITDINKLPWIEWSSVPYCEISDEEFEQYRLREGDILIARMADPGHGVMIEEDVEAVFASYLIRFPPRDGTYARFIQYWLRSDSYWELVRARHAGTTRASLNAQVLSVFQLAVPPLAIADAFGKKVAALRSKVTTNVAESRTLAALRNSLLPKLISGELRVRDAERIVGREV